MARPYPHRKTGVYWVRKVVPAQLRTAVGRRELKASLETKVAAEARRRAPPVLAKFESLIAAARNGAPEPTQRDIAAIAGEWYREQAAKFEDNPGSYESWEAELDYLSDRVENVGPDDGPPDEWDVEIKLRPSDLEEAGEVLHRHGFLPTGDTVRRVGLAIFEARTRLARVMQRRAQGDWRPDKNFERFPVKATRRTDAVPTGVNVQDLFDAWCRETQATGRRRYDREQTLKAFARFVGHHDADRVTAADAVRWKEARLGAGRSPATVARDMRMLSPLWKWGKVNRKLSSGNPFEGLAPREQKGRERKRGPFSEADALKLLRAARRETGALRWLAWVACLTGARLGEITQGEKDDVKQAGPDGPWFLHIHANGPGRSLKTPHSERQVPLHPALITEGFLDYVHALPARSPLFPDLAPDRFGKRVGTATKKHGRWARRTLGSSDRSVDPAHGWRHWAKDAARRGAVPAAVADAILGHLNPANEGEGYGRGYRFMPEVTAEWVRKIPAPHL